MNATSKARVLVTGGAGFIGSELTRQLASAGNSVVVVDNLINGRRENLAGIEDSSLQLIVADIRDGNVVERLLRGADIVFHLACLGVRHSIHSPLENHEVNAGATLKLLEASKNAGVKRFVYVSSSEVYGTATVAPMSEAHPTFPLTVYGASKLAGECYTRAFYHTHGYPTVVIRPFNTYGPHCHHEGDSGEVIPKFMLRSWAGRPMIIYGDGTQTRDFTYVSDTARGILGTGFAKNVIGHTINMGSGAEVSIKELAGMVAKVVDKPDARIIYDKPRPGDVLRLCADTSRIQQLIGFQPTIGLPEGLNRLKHWYQDQGKSPELLLEQEREHNWEPQRGRVHV